MLICRNMMIIPLFGILIRIRIQKMRILNTVRYFFYLRLLWVVCPLEFD